MNKEKQAKKNKLESNGWERILADGNEALRRATARVYQIRKSLAWAKSKMEAGEPCPVGQGHPHEGTVFSGQDQ